MEFQIVSMVPSHLANDCIKNRTQRLFLFLLLITVLKRTSDKPAIKKTYNHLHPSNYSLKTCSQIQLLGANIMNFFSATVIPLLPSPTAPQIGSGLVFWCGELSEQCTEVDRKKVGRLVEEEGRLFCWTSRNVCADRTFVTKQRRLPPKGFLIHLKATGSLWPSTCFWTRLDQLSYIMEMGVYLADI